MSVPIYQTKRYLILEDHNLDTDCCENCMFYPSSCMMFFVFHVVYINFLFLFCRLVI